MANWNRPTINSGYVEFVDEMNAKFADASRMYYEGSTGMPQGTVRLARLAGYTVFGLEEWDPLVTNTWIPRPIGIAYGGTGTTTAAGARANLGIGSMGTQNSNAVNITGGSITGVAYSANDITTGVLALARGGTGYPNSLTPYGTVFISDGSRVILYSGTVITELNASALVVGTVPAARLAGVAMLASNQVFSGLNTFTQNVQPGGPVEFQASAPGFSFINTAAVAGSKRMRLYYASNTQFVVERLDDAYTVATSVFQVSWDGYVVCYGGQIHNLNAANITHGQVANPAFLGAGAANTGTYLRGDLTWQPVASGGGSVEPVPSGLIAIFDTNCPAGWTRVAALDGRFPMGQPYWGAQGGSTQHSHSIGLNTSDAGSHQHGVGSSGQTSAGNTVSPINEGGQGATFNGSNSSFAPYYHSHHIDPLNVSVYGTTDSQGNHNHQINGGTATADHLPSYLTVVYCRKN